MSTLPACLQPRAGLQVFGFVPPGCFGFYVDNDESDPILREGEFAVIDVNDRQPEDGALFLIEWMSGGREIVEANLRSHPDPRTGRVDFRWWVAVYNRPRSRIEIEDALRAGRSLSTADGPYNADGIHLAEKIIGKVVGVLSPDRHSDEELRRLRDVARCPPHVLATGYGARPAGYIAPAGAEAYRGGSRIRSEGRTTRQR